jgi:uncharacterized membrane protein
MRFARAYFIILLVLCIFETMRLWLLAPATMASHFNALGSPDGYTSKVGFFIFEFKTVGVVVGLNLLLQILLAVLPAEWINMPNREYWLSAEHREGTLDKLSSFSAALFGGILLVLQVGFELAFYANMQKPIRFSAQWMVISIIAFIVFSFLMLASLIRSFRIPK